MLSRIKKFLLENSNVRQTILKNAFWLSVGAVGSKIIRAVMVIYAARVLGAGDYGIFSYAFGLVSIFSLFADIGLSPLLTRELSTHKSEEKRKYAGTIIIAKFCLLALSFILVAVFAPLVSNIPEANPLLLLVGLLIVFDSIRSFGFAIIRAENRMEKEARISFVTELLTAILAIFVLVFAPSVKNLVLSYLIGSGLGAIAILALMKDYLRGIWANFDRALAWKALKSALPYAMIGIFGGLMTNIDTYFIGYFMDADAVGLYAAALRPVMILYLLPAFLTIAIFPALNKYVTDENSGAVRSLSERAILATLGVAIPIAVGGLILGGSLMHNIFGAPYAGSILSFKILVLSIIPVFPGMIVGHMLFSKDARVSPVKAAVAGAVMNIVLDIILIPKFGIAGSAVATLASLTVMNTILFYEAKKISGIRLPAGIWKTVLASLFMGVIVYALLHAKWNSVFIIIMGAAVYVTMLYLLREKLLLEIFSSLKSKTPKN